MVGARTIVVLEDVPEVRELLRELTTEQGLRVRSAVSREEVLAELETALPELALLDVRLGGLELCRRLKAGPATRDLPILLLGEGSDAAERRRGFELGAADFLIRPFQAQELVARVRTHLELSRLRESERNYRLVADHTYDWEWMQDLEGTFTYSSPSCLRITGFQPGELPDRWALEEIIHGEDQAAWKAHQAAVRSHDLPGEVTFRIHHRDGSVRWIAHVCQPVFENTRCTGRRGSNRDITSSAAAAFSSRTITLWASRVEMTRFPRTSSRSGRSACERSGARRACSSSGGRNGLAGS